MDNDIKTIINNIVDVQKHATLSLDNKMNYSTAKKLFSIFYCFITGLVVSIFISCIIIFIVATILFLSLNKSLGVPHIAILIGIFSYFIIAIIIVYISYYLIYHKDSYYDILVNKYYEPEYIEFVY